jgi:hypothetical protein
LAVQNRARVEPAGDSRAIAATNRHVKLVR